MPANRSRSSTVSSSQRLPVPSAHQPLHSHSAAATTLAESQQQGFAPKSYNSLHSLKTLHGGAQDEEEEGGAGSERRGDRDGHSSGRRAPGPQFVIELDAGGGRARSATFGGVELPPAGGSLQAVRGEDDDKDKDTDREETLARPLLSQRGRTASVSSRSARS